MSKIELNDTLGGFNISTINDNFEAVEREFNDKVLYRDAPAGEPNAMEGVLDMNGHSIINVGNITAIGGDATEAEAIHFIPTDLIHSTNVQDAIEEVLDIALDNETQVLNSITNYDGIVADGTDQTAKMVTYFSGLSSSTKDSYYFPYNLKYNVTTVNASIPAGVIVQDYSAINAWNTPGYVQNIVGITDIGKADGTVDTQFRVSSGHNASYIVDNRGTSGSNSAVHGVGAFIWGRGQLTKGQPGVRTLARHEWSKIPGENKWWWVMRREMPWVAEKWEYWYSGLSYTIGDHIRTENGGVYRATTTGTSGSTEPNWAKNVTASDGGVSWICIDRTIDQGIFSISEKGEIATNTGPQDGLVAYLKASQDSSGSGGMLLEGNGASKSAFIKFAPTTAAGAISSMPMIFAQDGVGIRFIRTDTTNEFARVSDARGFQLGAHSPIEGLVTNNSPTPSVSGIGLLRLANTASTMITSLSGSLPSQIVQLWAENNNTTLQHDPSAFVLRDGANVNIPANQSVYMQKYSGSAAWFEVGRTFPMFPKAVVVTATSGATLPDLEANVNLLLLRLKQAGLMFF